MPHKNKKSKSCDTKCVCVCGSRYAKYCILNLCKKCCFACGCEKHSNEITKKDTCCICMNVSNIDSMNSYYHDITKTTVYYCDECNKIHKKFIHSLMNLMNLMNLMSLKQNIKM